MRWTDVRVGWIWLIGRIFGPFDVKFENCENVELCGYVPFFKGRKFERSKK